LKKLYLFSQYFSLSLLDSMEGKLAQADKIDVKSEVPDAEPIPEEAKIDSTGEWAYNKYIELLTPTIIKSSIEKGMKVKNDMMDTVTWLNTMSNEKKQELTDLATGAVTMTKEAVAVLTATTSTECQRISTSLAEQGLSKTVQDTAVNTFTKAQELYTLAIGTANSVTEEVTNKAKLKREEVLASEALVAAHTWAEAAKKAVEENAVVTSTKAIGGDALKLAEESYNGALQYAEKQRVEATNLTLMYLAAAQDQMSFITESEQGKNLVERTKKLIELAKKVPSDHLPAKSVERLDSSYKQASEMVKSAQDWVSAVLGFEKEGKEADDKRVLAQFQIIEALENEV